MFGLIAATLCLCMTLLYLCTTGDWRRGFFMGLCALSFLKVRWSGTARPRWLLWELALSVALLFDLYPCIIKGCGWPNHVSGLDNPVFAAHLRAFESGLYQCIGLSGILDTLLRFRVKPPEPDAPDAE